jgi:uncharacterized membrane protein
MKTIARWLLAIFFVLAGLNHFREPEIYFAMMPSWVSAPALANTLSGVAELLGGLGLLVPATRRAAGWGLCTLLVAVFPANVHVALQGHMTGFSFSPWVLWMRLPFQAVFLLWVWWVGLQRSPSQRQRSGNPQS